MMLVVEVKALEAMKTHVPLSGFDLTPYVYKRQELCSHAT